MLAIHITLKVDLRFKLDINEVVNIFTTRGEDVEKYTPPVSWMWLHMNFMSGAFSSKTLVSI